MVVLVSSLVLSQIKRFIYPPQYFHTKSLSVVTERLFAYLEFILIENEKTQSENNIFVHRLNKHMRELKNKRPKKYSLPNLSKHIFQNFNN
jgi:hypothetical protein